MSRILAEGLPAPSLDDGEPCILAYADNLNVIGTDKDRVQKVKDDITTHLEKIGLRVHEVMDANTIVEGLGFTIDGKSGRVLPIADRVAKVIAAFKWLARRPRVTGRVVEKLIGRAVHFMLLRREMLSIFRSSYDFVGASYQHRCRLWKSVAKEAEWAANLLQICSANLKRNWSTVVTASDASLSGIAVCARKATLTEIKRIGLCPESWRFRSKHAVNPRESVFHTEKLDPVDPFSNVDTVKPVISNPSAYDDPYELNPDFKEIPIQFMHESHWGLRFAAHMQHSEAITILEARGTVAAVRHLLRDVKNFGLQFIHLNDNLANVLCSEKGRSGSYPMLRCCRRLCALVLAGDLGIHHRWVPSELNPADHGSRRWESWRTSGREEKFKKTSNKEEILLGVSFTRTCGDLPKNSVIHGPSSTKGKHQGSHQEEIASKLKARKSSQEESVHGGTPGCSKVRGTDTAGTGGGVDSCGIGLCQEASNISTVCPGQSTEFANRPEVRRELQRVSELLICRRARYNRRIKTFCSHAGRLPSLGTQVTTSKIKKMPSGMDKVGPRMHSSTHSFPADSFDGNHHVQESSRGSSGGYSYNVRGLSQAGRGSIGIQAADVIKPNKSSRSVVVNLHPSKRAESSKVGLADESIAMDSQELPFLGHLLLRLAKAKSQTSLFGLEYHTMRSIWEQTLIKIGLPLQQCVMYQLRHAGPSHDRLNNYRTSLEVKLRGRWSADSSVQRYEKHALINAEFQALPRKIQKECVEAQKSLKNVVQSSFNRLHM